MTKSIVIFTLNSLFVFFAHAQKAPAPLPAPEDRPRIFITDSQSWETSGSAGGTGGTFAAHSSGGARPQTAEIVKTFGEKCPQVTINNIQQKANYVVVLDHEGGKGALRHKNKIAVFDAQSGDSVVSKSTLSLGGSVEEACRGIVQHWSAHKPGAAADANASPVAPVGATSRAATEVVTASAAHLNVSSTPDGADIEIDGNFVGNTPSSLQLAPGDYAVAVKKTGYKNWERKMKVGGGDINIKAELEKEK